LLAFSRQQPLRPQATDMAGLCQEMAAMLSRTLGESVRIETDVPQDSWPAMVDSGELENAILNLAINARDAMPAGGTLTLESRNIELGKDEAAQHEDVSAGDYVRLSVRDTGAGMSPDVLEHAFEPFYTTKRFGKGSGLGLSMVYGFTTQSGGFATIESECGVGTSVHLYLPRAGQCEGSKQEIRQPCVSDGDGETILVVEDNPDVRRLTVTLLSAMKYKVVQAEDGESAMPIIRGKGKIDLLLSDVVLPGDMSGPAIAEEALQRRPRLPVLFMSGYAEDVIRRDREGGDATVDADLLTKPFTRAQLGEKVKAALGLKSEN
jgi:two-component system CheB/CheR fusion protein